MQAQFSQTIAESRQDLAATVDSVREPIAGPKHYAMSFAGGPGGLQPGEGFMSPVYPKRRIDATHVSYVVRYTYRYPDGHLEEDVVPWEFVYPVNDDPFARHDHLVYMQAPPASFRPTRPLTPKEQEAYDYAQSRRS
jgi:hypothetical protein